MTRFRFRKLKSSNTCIQFNSIQFNLFNQIIKIIYISIHTWVLVYNVKYNEWFGTPGKHNTANPAQVESAGTKETAPNQRKPDSRGAKTTKHKEKRTRTLTPDLGNHSTHASSTHARLTAACK